MLSHDMNLADTVSSLLINAGGNIVIPAYRSQISKLEFKDDGSIVTETDLKCQRFLSSELLRMFPDIGFLGEEMSLDEQLACLNGGERFWCVDPLDGTGNFTIPMPHFALSLALIENGKPCLAVIHDPVANETWIAVKDGGAFLNNMKITVSRYDKLPQAVGFIDFKRLDADRATLLATRKIFRSQRNIGSCALEWAWLAAGRAHFIIHGGEKIWDYSAGSLIAEEAGAIVSDFNGRHPFHTNQISSPIVATTHRDTHDQLLALLQSV